MNRNRSKIWPRHQRPFLGVSIYTLFFDNTAHSADGRKHSQTSLDLSSGLTPNRRHISLDGEPRTQCRGCHRGSFASKSAGGGETSLKIDPIYYTIYQYTVLHFLFFSYRRARLRLSHRERFVPMKKKYKIQR
jgi:hypothetical protein